MPKSYEALCIQVRALQDRGELPTHVTREQAADWAYGNTKIENDAVTRDMADAAAIKLVSDDRG